MHTNGSILFIIEKNCLVKVVVVVVMSKGEVSKAYRAIVSDAKVLPYTQDGLQFLQSKNPAVSPGKAPWMWDEENSYAEEPVPIAFDSVVKLIRSTRKGASCGVDNFPVDILKQLTKTMAKKEFPTDTRLFLDLLIGFLNTLFIHGQCPPGVLSFYDAGELIRLRQGATKIRPIGKATTYRKIMDVAQQISHRLDLQNEFGDIQFCGAAFGTERMQNAMNIHSITRCTVHLTTKTPTATQIGPRFFRELQELFQRSYPQSIVAWKQCRTSYTSGVSRIRLRSSKRSVSPRVRPPAGNCTIWEFTPSTRNYPLWPFSTMLAYYQPTLMT